MKQKLQNSVNFGESPRYEFRARQTTSYEGRIKKRRNQPESVKKTKKKKFSAIDLSLESIELLYSDESQFASLSEKSESKETVEEIQHRNNAYHRFLKNYKWMEEIFSTVAPELVDEKASEEVEKECDLLEQECNVEQNELAELEQKFALKEESLLKSSQDFTTTYQNLIQSGPKFRPWDNLAITSPEYIDYTKKVEAKNAELQQDPAKFVAMNQEIENMKKRAHELQKVLAIMRRYPSMSYAEKLGQRQEIPNFPPQMFASKNLFMMTSSQEPCSSFSQPRQGSSMHKQTKSGYVGQYIPINGGSFL